MAWRKRSYHKRFGKHAIAYETEFANEFFELKPENIIAAEDSTSVYIIEDVSPLVITNDDVVTVTFYSNTPNIQPYGDWIGAYSPANIDITKTVPVKYGWCDEDPNYDTTGRGTLSFNMTNLRSDIAFYYFTSGVYYPKYMNVSQSNVTFENINQPLRPRVVATGNPDVFNLLWSSAYSTHPTLMWGRTQGTYTVTVEANTSTIERKEMLGAPANTTGWRDLGLIHTAPLHGMIECANENIYYIFGDAATDDWSEEHSFHCPPLAGTQPSTRPTRVILYDDMGRGSTDDTYTWNEYGRPAIETMYAVGHEVSMGNVDAIYHGGDVSYATGYMAVWDFFMDELAPSASGALYLTTVGNHESDCPNSPSYYIGSTSYGKYGDSGGECGVPATRLLPMPAPATTNKPWWSYDIGLIHFVGMSTEHDYTIGSEQNQWLEADLAEVNRTKTPWIIFGGHRAMYLNSNYGEDVTSDIVVMDNLIYHIEPMLWKYRVNLAFWGHNHVVQRHAAVKNKTTIQRSTQVYEDGYTVPFAYHNDPQATVHMVIGTAGAKFTVNYVEPYPEWNEMVFYRYGYARVSTVNSTRLEWEWVSALDNEVYDRMVIDQSDATKGWTLPDDDDDGSGHTSSDKDSGWSSYSGLEKGLVFASSAVAVSVLSIAGYMVVTDYVLKKRNPLLPDSKESDNLNDGV